MAWTKEDQSLAQRRYLERHRDEINARNRARRRERGDEYRAVKKAWRDANREKVAEYTSRARRKWYDKKGSEYMRAYRLAHLESERQRASIKESRRRAQKRRSPGMVTSAEWSAIKAKQRGRCAYCNKKCVLHMDHVVPLARGGCHMAHNIVGACKPCNSRKHANLITAEVSLFDAVA